MSFGVDKTNVTLEHELSVPGVVVWTGINADGLVASCFHGTVTGQIYLQSLKNLSGTMDTHPALAGNDFLQDGAPPHYTLIMCQYLDVHVANCIGIPGKMDWPARSCHLAPCNFFLCGLLNDHVFTR